MKEITAAIRNARDEPTSQNIEAMWRRVMGLPAWYLLPAALDAATTPLVAQLDDGDWIVAFTHFRALNEFARERGMRSDTGEVPMLALQPGEAVERIRELSDHVAGVVFNPGSELAFRAPVAALLDFVARFEAR